jgi:alkylation response protein AidB-like acyl-CoA dehydrogenase
VSNPPTSQLDLLYSGVEEDLRSSVRKLLTDRGAAAAVLARCESADPYDLPLWRTMTAELGLAGLLIPEELGGAGAGPREVAVVAEEVGRSVAPVPFLGSAVLATSTLLSCAEPDPLLGALAQGERTATLAVPLTTAPDTAFPQGIRAEAGTLRGRVTSVVDLEVADAVLVPAYDEDGPAIYALDLPARGARVEAVVPLDLTRRIADLTLESAPARRIAATVEAGAALTTALTMGAGLLASEQVGLADWCLESTVDFTRTRYQFGRPIGSFQAISHKFAELATEIAQVRLLVRWVASLTDEDPRRMLPREASMAKLAATELAKRCALEGVQIMGGYGYANEYPMERHLRTAVVTTIYGGTSEIQKNIIAKTLGL